MKCPKCGINLLEHIDVCPFCKTPIPKEKENEAEIQETIEQQTSTGLNKPSQNTGRYSASDPSRDSYDFENDKMFEYDFTQKIPVTIYNGELEIDLSRFA